MRKTAQQQWDEVPDLATPAERRWIDEWKAYPGRFGCQRTAKVTQRRADGTFGFMDVKLGKSKWVLRRGVMAITLDYIKQEVRRYRREAKRERAKLAEQETGAYI